jgi:two-component system, OmpR family, sensor kinase
VVAVEVRDHGPGFPPEFLPRAFERFQRADPARSRTDGGAGLGLAVVASIARAHGGHADAGNHPGGGAWATIELPFDSGQ